MRKWIVGVETNAQSLADRLNEMEEAGYTIWAIYPDWASGCANSQLERWDDYYTIVAHREKGDG